MPTPAPVLAPPPMGRQVAPYVAQRRARQLKAPSFALDVARIVSGVFSASYSFPINGHLEAGPILAAGSPSRARLERYNTAEVGGFASWFPIGNRVKGAGFTGRARYLYGWGEGESDSGGTIDASAHAVSASALVTARYTALTGLRLEVQGGLMWLSSRAQATEGETTKRSKLDVPLSTVSLLVGWTF
ncbi:MAG: hypothetical protein KC502_20945 [Myxococcales bacterium]|nr:hypothetical protein [Myxococcales bacterium]